MLGVPFRKGATMADNDIYDSKRGYEQIRDSLEGYLVPPSEMVRRGSRKYYIKNKENLRHFRKLMGSAREKGIFDSRDTSYIRRLRLFRTLMIAAYILDKDFQVAEREDIDNLVAMANDINHSPKSKKDFNIDIKFLWKQLFPEKDEKGRIADNLAPYAVRHLSGKMDKSREKLRGDKFSLEEFERLISALGDDPRMQCLLTVTLESLSRPQELLGRRIRDLEMFDNYAKIYISEHGKEGVGFLRVIESYPYLVRWMNVHPLRKDPDAHLFVNTGRTNRNKQFKPFAANKIIRERCQKIGLRKPITLYSLKRNGVTLMRLSGKSDLEIQHTARWTTTKQIHTYDMSGQEESFKIELIKRGKIKAEAKYTEFQVTVKKCLFCNTENGMADSYCSKCQRPLDREAIEKEAKEKDTKLATMTNTIQDMAAKQERLEGMFLQALAAMNPETAKKKLTPELVKKFVETDRFDKFHS
jgi:integrase